MTKYANVMYISMKKKKKSPDSYMASDSQMGKRDALLPKLWWLHLKHCGDNDA